MPITSVSPTSPNVFTSVGSNPAALPEDGPQANVTQGEIPETDSLGLFVEVGAVGSIFTDYKVVSRFERDQHKFMLPIASPTPFNGKSVSFVRLAKPTLLWIVSWSASKIGTAPEPPLPEAPTGWELLDDQYELQQMNIMADGVTYAYSMSGVYIFGCTNPSDFISDNINFPLPPWATLGSNSRTIPLSNFIPGIF